MASFVQSTARDIERRLEELKAEISRLEAALTALGGNASQSAASRGKARAAASPRQRLSKTRHAPKAASPARGRRSGARARRALELVRQKPGVTVGELASSMQIQPNYLYRVLPKLAAQGQVKREGNGWHPA